MSVYKDYAIIKILLFSIVSHSITTTTSDISRTINEY